MSTPRELVEARLAAMSTRINVLEDAAHEATVQADEVHRQRVMLINEVLNQLPE